MARAMAKNNYASDNLETART